MFDWIDCSFQELGVERLYDCMALRSEVFVVEQECIYNDLDGVDKRSRHLLGLDGETVVACARWFEVDGSTALGRIVTADSHRGQGLGREMMRQALDRIGDGPVHMHAQAHLQPFYEEFGFAREGETFLEDGIPHVMMRRR